VARVRAGDDEAFEAIYDRYARGLLAFCHQLLASREEAEDALQQSFGSAYTTLRSSDRGVELRPWLYTIARNRCLSMLRSRRKDVSLDGAQDCGGVADGLTEEVQRRSDLRELMDDLRRLPDDQRAALVLFEFGDLPHDEIAAVLDVRREKVKALVFQAREGLIRARQARELPCTEMRQQLATLSGKVPRRSMLRRHVDRCPSCAMFESQVDRQRAGLAIIFPVLPTVGLKGIILGSAVGRGAAAAGGSVGAGGCAAVLGGAGGGGGALACAGAGGGAAGLAGAGAGLLAGAAAGGVSGTLATAGGAGTLAAALGAKGASAAVVKLLAVVVVGGGAASTGDVVTHASGRDHAPAVHATAPAVAASPVIQELLGPPARPAADPASGASTAADPAAQHDPQSQTASDPAPAPAAPSPAPTSPTGGTPAPMGTLPASSGPTHTTAATQPTTTAEPDATSQAPPATSSPGPTTTTTTTTTTGATPVSGASAPTQTTATPATPATATTTTTTTAATAATPPAAGGTAPGAAPAQASAPPSGPNPAAAPSHPPGAVATTPAPTAAAP
jgi:RNA polymerase sigma factor (sigma-70 family)